MGDLTADILRLAAGTEVGLMPSGALRGDIPRGEVSLEDLTDVFPFRDRLEVLQLSGGVLRAAVEQGLGLERGMLQVSGLEVCYDPAGPVGERALWIRVGGVELVPGATYSAATITLLAQGGDLYRMFTRAVRKKVQAGPEFVELLRAWFAEHEIFDPPSRGRLLTVPDCR